MGRCGNGKWISVGGRGFIVASGGNGRELGEVVVGTGIIKGAVG